MKTLMAPFVSIYDDKFGITIEGAGCGCCAGYETLTADNLQQVIDDTAQLLADLQELQRTLTEEGKL